MTKKKFVFVLVFSLTLILVGLSSQEEKTVLTPDDPNEARLNRLQPPAQVMDAIGVKPGMVVAEIGAGRGRYVVQLAVRVGQTGKVYAEDIDAPALRYLEGRCDRWGLKNVETILGDVKDAKLPEAKLDLIFIISAYHHFEDPVSLLSKARAALKTDGVLAIGEWTSSSGTQPDRLKAQMIEAGYAFDRIETFLEKNNMLIYIFRKNS